MGHLLSARHYYVSLWCYHGQVNPDRHVPCLRGHSFLEEQTNPVPTGAARNTAGVGCWEGLGVGGLHVGRSGEMFEPGCPASLMGNSTQHLHLEAY